MSGVVINLPYAGSSLPPAVASRLGLTPDELRLEHWRLTDPILADIVRKAALIERRGRAAERPLIINGWSPLTADPWGLWAAELAAAEGQDFRPEDLAGRPAILPCTTAGQAIKWNGKDLEIILSRSAYPFHEQIEQAARDFLACAPLVLIVTVRSFTSMPLGFEASKKYPRPQVCVSTSPGLTPGGLAGLAGNTFRICRWWPELNWPHRFGACVPRGLVGSPRVRSLGLSLSRSLYMDERSGRKKETADGISRVLATLFNLFDEELVRVAGLRLNRMIKPKQSPIIKADR